MTVQLGLVVFYSLFFPPFIVSNIVTVEDMMNMVNIIATNDCVLLVMSINFVSLQKENTYLETFPSDLNIKNMKDNLIVDLTHCYKLHRNFDFH